MLHVVGNSKSSSMTTQLDELDTYRKKMQCKDHLLSDSATASLRQPALLWRYNGAFYKREIEEDEFWLRVQRVLKFDTNGWYSVLFLFPESSKIYIYII